MAIRIQAFLHSTRAFLDLDYFAIISMALSGVFLYFAQRTIPVSTAYIIWTGLGAIGTLLIGIMFFGDSASLLRMFFALLTLVGIVGLELTSK